MESQELKIYQNRLLVADLIEQVLLNKIDVKEALVQFPKDKNDINIKCAFDALMHRVADEDLRSKISGYAQTQDDYLIEISRILKDNRSLPKNIIGQYLKYHSDDLLSSNDSGLKNVLKKLKRMINF